MSNIREVAKEAGVSIATVSRVLTGDTGFKTTEQTRASVKSAAEKLRYIHRPAARAKKKVQLGCMLALTAEKYADPFFTAILSAAEEQCAQEGAVISVVRNYNELRDPAVLNELCSAGLSGIFLMEQVPKDMLDRIRGSIPHILSIDNDEYGYQFNGVGFDHFEANMKVMDCLLTHGYRRIAVVSGSSPNEPFEESMRLLSYRESLRRAGIPFDAALIKDCGWDLDLCARQTCELMELPAPPDAIFAGSDSLASAVLGQLYAMELRCPDDVGVIGFNNISLSAHMVPPLTTVEIPTHDIGVSAVRRLMAMIRGDNGSRRKILFPTELVLRASLREAQP